jgi:hypothetical protein
MPASIKRNAALVSQNPADNENQSDDADVAEKFCETEALQAVALADRGRRCGRDEAVRLPPSDVAQDAFPGGFAAARFCAHRA